MAPTEAPVAANQNGTAVSAAAIPVLDWLRAQINILLQRRELAIGLVLLLVLRWRDQRLDARLQTLCLLPAVFALMLFRARRFIEYFPSPVAVISQRFGADYVFADWEHEAFLREAAVDPHLHELYRDQYAVIFAVASPKPASVD